MAIGTAIATAAGLVTATGALTVGGAILAGVINVAASFGLSAIVRAIEKRRATETPLVGVNGSVRAGGIVPCSFIHGRWATAGSLAYRGTWGTDGNTPNAYYVQVLSLSDLPVTGLVRLMVAGRDCAFNPNATPAGNGIPLTEFRVEDKDHCWVRFHDGSQSTADAYLVSHFAGHPQYPWTSSAIGTGVAYVVVTTLVNRELFSGWPEVLATVDGIKRYDLREDETVGGAGDQRWSNTATHAFGENPMITAYNVLRGLSFGGQPFYGPKRVAAAHLPFSEWAAAANECDLEVELDGGGTEPQFRAGGEITVDTPPADVLDALMTASNGKVVEAGGIYKPRIGAPAAASAAITDADIIVTEGQSLTPFFAISDTINGIAGRYVSEVEGWGWKDAPPRFYPAFEAKDGGRRMTSVTFAAVRSPTQAQRLMDAGVKASRRQRSHLISLPPQFGLFEPGEAVAWTSARNGYAGKLFEVVGATDRDDLIYMPMLREVEPGDYDWNPSDEIPASSEAIVIPGVAAQPIADWTATGVVIDGADGRQRAAILLGWDPDVDDVDGVQYEIRLAATSEVILRGETDFLAAAGLHISQNILAATAYEARGRYRAASPRPTSWSTWLAVTTPDVRIPRAALDQALDALLRSVESQLPDDLLVMRQQLDDLGTVLNAQVTTILERLGRLNLAVGARHGESMAAVEAAMTAAADADSALAAFVVDLVAGVGDSFADGRLRFATSVAPSGVLASFAIEVRASTGDDFASSGHYIDAGVTSLGGASRIRLATDQLSIETPGGDVLFSDGKWTSSDGRLEIDFTAPRILMDDGL